MDYNTLQFDDATAEIAFFSKGRKEAHAIIHYNGSNSFAGQWESINNAVKKLEDYFGGMAPVFQRFFFTDIFNQSEYIGSETSCPVSYIQQPPLDGSKISLWVVFQENPNFKQTKRGLWEDDRGFIVFENPSDSCGNSFDCTVFNLEKVATELESRGASLLNNCVRTWFMVHDIDTNYKGVVDGRNLVFDRYGLTKETHFISSTGIGGTSNIKGQIVSFNAICNTNLKPSQMKFVYGASHLNPTIEYGVAFERGTIVDFGDRRHVYISGTASIDNKGEILHPCDIKKQTERMIQNIIVLLNEAECSERDIAHLIVYLRDVADYNCVSNVFDTLLPDIPRLLVLAPVCRPGWLVETECMAIKDISNSEYPDF